MYINYSILICYAQNITCVIAYSYIKYKLSDTCSIAITCKPIGTSMLWAYVINRANYQAFKKQRSRWID